MSMAHGPGAQLVLVAVAFSAVLVIPAYAQLPQSEPASASQAKTPATSKRRSLAADAKKAKDAYRQGLHAEQAGRWEPAYDAYSDAVEWAPENQQYFVHREIARSRLVQ